jgi:hypothetical protein
MSNHFHNFIFFFLQMMILLDLCASCNLKLSGYDTKVLLGKAQNYDKSVKSGEL